MSPWQIYRKWFFNTSFILSRGRQLHSNPLAHNTSLFAGCQMAQSSPSMPPAPPLPCYLSQPFCIGLSLTSDRSCWWSVRLASSRWRDDSETDKERATLSPCGADEPGSKRGNWVDRESFARDIIMTDCMSLGLGENFSMKVAASWQLLCHTSH